LSKRASRCELQPQSPHERQPGTVTALGEAETVCGCLLRLSQQIYSRVYGPSHSKTVMAADAAQEVSVSKRMSKSDERATHDSLV